MKRVPAWLTYTVLRLLFVAVPLVVLLIVIPGEYWIFSAVAAVAIGFCLSYLLLRKPRDAVSQQLYEARHRERTEAKPTADDIFEDAVVDDASAHEAEPTKGAGAGERRTPSDDR